MKDRFIWITPLKVAIIMFLLGIFLVTFDNFSGLIIMIFSIIMIFLFIIIELKEKK